MTPFEKLTDNEKIMFDLWSSQGMSGRETKETFAPLEERLRYWNLYKKKLFNIFNQNLILRKSLSSLEQTSKWIDHFSVLYNHDFFNIIRWDYNIDPISKYFSVSDLANNRLSKDIEIKPIYELYDILSFKKGTKVIKVLSKIAKIVHAEKEFERFRLEHSILAQEKRIKGQLCLSIHPLDFITMSDNSYKWTSCMSLLGGDYCAGTIEMMNSSVIVCVYLEGEKPFYIDKEKQLTWSNKKWRCLFVVTPDYIIPIKDYPYQSPVLETIAIKWLAELMEQNDSDHPKYHSELLLSKKESFTCKYFLSENKQVELILQTNVMYNDTGTKQVYYLVNQNIYKQQEPEKKFINYSGPLTCLWCGDLEGDSTDEPQFLSCVNCRKDWYCCICDKKLEKDEALLYQHHLYICEACLQDCHFTLGNDNSLRSYRDSIQIIAIPNVNILDKVNLPCDKDFVLEHIRKTKFLHHYIDCDYFVSSNITSCNRSIADYLNKTFPQYFKLNEEQVKQLNISSFYSTGIGVNENLYAAFSPTVFIDEKGLTPEGRVKFAEMVSPTDQQDLASAEDYLKELESEISVNSTIISRRTQI